MRPANGCVIRGTSTAGSATLLLGCAAEFKEDCGFIGSAGERGCHASPSSAASASARTLINYQSIAVSLPRAATAPFRLLPVTARWLAATRCRPAARAVVQPVACERRTWCDECYNNAVREGTWRSCWLMRSTLTRHHVSAASVSTCRRCRGSPFADSRCRAALSYVCQRRRCRLQHGGGGVRG
jgi:hypothetical protein